MTVEIPSPGGMLAGLIDADAGITPRAIAVLGHPLPTAGGTMHTKAMFHAAKALARIGCPAVRFNFHSVERATDNFAAALDFMCARYPAVSRVRAGGMSFGSWVGMTVGAADPRVTSLIGIAVPVTKYDFSTVIAAGKPTFLIHGERDEHASVKDVRRFYAQLSEPKELVVIDGADHLFDGKVMEVGDAIEDLLQDYDG